ncbi:MAG: leucine-rich repeat protein, partial [Clostridia bacterium]|nr:leucine-rich repeat protein [Clostridia bacterium]
IADGKATITGFMGVADEFVIPSEVEGCLVVEIADKAFYNASFFSSIVIPETIETIGDSAFYGCSAFDNLVLPEGVREIGDNAFYACSGLISITIPASVESIGKGIVYGTGISHIIVDENNKNYSGDGNCIVDKNTGTLIAACNNSVIPDNGSVKNIGDSVFGGTSIENIILPEGVTSIGSYAFAGCSFLKSVALPSTLEHIGSGAFYNCYGLEGVYIKDLTAWFNISFGQHISSGGYMYDMDTNPLSVAGNLYLNGALVTELVVPSDVTEIKDYLFSGCRSIKNVVIHENVTSIGDQTFEYCSNLKSIDIPEKVTSIGWRAFVNCTGLESIKINGAPNMDEYVFYYCTGLKSVVLGEGMTKIPRYTFQYCSALESIKLPDTVKVIDAYAFYNCKNLFDITVPEGLTAIGTNALYGTPYYNNRDNWEDNVLYFGSILLTADSTLSGNYTIKAGTTAISDNAFEYCRNLESIVLPDGLVSIGSYAFGNCYNLNNIEFPVGLEIIGNYAFNYCESLEVLELPEGLKTVGNGAFSSCNGLKSVTIPSTLESVGFNAFDNYNTSVMEAVYISDMEAFCKIDFTTEIRYTYGVYEEIVTGYSANPLYYAENLYLNGELVTDLIIPEGLTEIKNNTFCCATCIKSVSIPVSVEKIADNAFRGCSSLETVSFEGTEEVWNSVEIGNENTYLEEATITFGTAEPPSPVITPGDISGDGQVNAKDSNVFKRVLAGELSIKADSTEFAAIDLNSDGELNAKDANILAQFLAGVINEL